MTNRPPTLAEMTQLLSDKDDEVLNHSDEVELESPPTLSEMLHALETKDEVLKHYGIKGMRWGFRRSRQELAAVTNSDGERVGGIRTQSKKDAEQLRNMKTGSVLVLDTMDGPTVVSKQSDGTFKKVTMSADAQNVLRTVNKDPVEMSTREIGEANKRAQAIEQYNKIFNPTMDPNAELKARAEAMELQQKYAAAQAKMNPSKAARVGNFVNDLSPAFNLYVKANKDMDGALNNNLVKLWNKFQGAAADASTATTAQATKTKKSKRSKSAPDVVYDITTMGQDDPLNPFIPEFGR